MSTAPYKATGNGRRLSMLRARSVGPNSALAGLDSLVARSRDLVRNEPWVAAASKSYVVNLVGTGIEPRPIWGTAEHKALVKKLWKKSCREFDADGAVEFLGMQATVAKEVFEAGEVFIRIRPRRSSDGLAVPVQFQILESEQCPRDMNTARGKNTIVNGIEFTPFGLKVGYYFHPKHPGDAGLGATYEGNQPVFVEASKIIHIFAPQRAGQVRGVPRTAAAMIPIHNLAQYLDASIEVQKNAKLFGCFIETPANTADGADPVMDDLVTAHDEAGEPMVSLEAGMTWELRPGQKAVFSDPPTAGSDFAEFLRVSLMSCASSMGIPFEVLTGDLRNISDRALKLQLHEFRRLLEQDQWLYFIPQFLQKVRAAWFDTAVAEGILQIEDYETIRDDVIETTWVGQGWPYTHPVQDVTADISAINAGLTSRSEVVMSNGEDIEEIDAQQAVDNARADSLGLTYTSDSRQKKGTAAAPAEPIQEVDDAADPDADPTDPTQEN